MSRPRDSQRSRCYAAERAAVARVPGCVMPSIGNVQRYVDDAVRSDWWAERCAYAGPVLVRTTRRTNKATARAFITERQGRDSLVRLAANIMLPAWGIGGGWAWCDWVFLHELAHVGRFTERGIMRWAEPSHSPAWAGLYLTLVGEFMGSEPAEVLAEEFEHHKVRLEAPAPMQLEMAACLQVAAREP